MKLLRWLTASAAILLLMQAGNACIEELDLQKMIYYENTKFPKWTNSLFISALVPGAVTRLEVSGSQITNEEILFSDLGRVRDIATSPDGSLILATDGSQGKLIRVTNK